MKDHIYQVRAQLNGCYMPDSMTLFSSFREAKSYALSLAREHDSMTRELPKNEHHAYYFVRDNHQQWSREHNSWPYMYVVEPVSWRHLAHDLGVKTRREVLEHECNY